MFYQLSCAFMRVCSKRRFKCGAIFGIGLENAMVSVFISIILL